MSHSKIFPPVVSELYFIEFFLNEEIRVKRVLSVILENAEASYGVYSLQSHTILQNKASGSYYLPSLFRSGAQRYLFTKNRTLSSQSSLA